ncbi:hypothetical protein HJG60_012138 [Phyllostomus discolor]|uniref:Uncharacterized protein n=1 Tax=Phyllostomus discolor TaxID=89673 RepID=A0A834DWF7_9CHIR|nr:hypothetical protein HJG60_012138 [Phyllostomus discolor]
MRESPPGSTHTHRPSAEKEKLKTSSVLPTAQLGASCVLPPPRVLEPRPAPPAPIHVSVTLSSCCSCSSLDLTLSRSHLRQPAPPDPMSSNTSLRLSETHPQQAPPATCSGVLLVCTAPVPPLPRVAIWPESHALRTSAPHTKGVVCFPESVTHRLSEESTQTHTPP